MPELPVVSGADAVRTLERLGFAVARQRGSRVAMRRGSPGCVAPRHRESKAGTLAGLPEQAGIPVDEFIAATNEKQSGSGRFLAKR